MEGYINEKEIFRDAKSSDRFPKIYSQMAGEAQS